MTVEAVDNGLEQTGLEITRTAVEVERIRIIVNHIMANSGRGCNYSTDDGQIAQGVSCMAEWILGDEAALEDLGIDFTQWQ